MSITESHSHIYLGFKYILKKQIYFSGSIRILEQKTNVIAFYIIQTGWKDSFNLKHLRNYYFLKYSI